MTKTTLDAQSLFRAGRELAPPPGHKELLRSRILQIEAGVALGGTAALAKGSSLKLVVFKAGLFVLAASTVAVALYLLHGGAPPLRPQRVQSTPILVAPAASVAPSKSTSQEPAIAPAPDGAHSMRALQALPVKPSPPGARLARARAAPIAENLSAELELLRQAQEALTSGNGQRALSLLEQHEKQFPASRLAHERRATRIFALCALREPAGRAEVQTFLADFPKSPLARRVRSACQIEPMP